MGLKKGVGRVIDSRLAGWVANLPPLAWLARRLARSWATRQLGSHPAPLSREDISIGRPSGLGLDFALQQVVYDVVTALGYSGAMVATHEQGDALPVRALFVDPNLATMEQIHTTDVIKSMFVLFVIHVIRKIQERVKTFLGG